MVEVKVPTPSHSSVQGRTCSVKRERDRDINKGTSRNCPVMFWGGGGKPPHPSSSLVIHPQFRWSRNCFSPKGKGSGSPSVYKGESRELGNLRNRKQRTLSQGIHSRG